MSHKKLFLLSAVLAVVGSAINFYSTNLLLSDIANNFYGARDVNFISSLPGFFLAANFTIMLIYFARCERKPQYRKRMTLHYALVIAVLSALGIISTVFSAIYIYKDFFTPYPFIGFIPVGIIIHGLIIAFALIVRGRCKEKMPDDERRRKMTVGHILFTALLLVIVYIALYRLGAALWSPVYIQWSTFYKTFPFYLSMLQFMAAMVFMFIYVCRSWDGHKTASIVFSLIMLAVSVLLAVYGIFFGIPDTEFVSAISPAMPIERLLTSPIILFVHYPAMVIASLYCLIQTRKVRRVKGVPENGWRRPKAE